MQAIRIIDRPSPPGRFCPCRELPASWRWASSKAPRPSGSLYGWGWGAGATRTRKFSIPRGFASSEDPPTARGPQAALPPEPLLTRGIPDLELDAFSGLDLHQTGEEIHPHGGVRNLGKAALGEAANQTGLAHRGIPDDNEPELVQPDGLHGWARQVCIPGPEQREGASRRGPPASESAARSGSRSAASTSLDWEPEAR